MFASRIPGRYEDAFTEALNFNCPQLFWDPVMRAAALSQMGRKQEARTTVGELLKLEPDFAIQGQRLISRYVKVDDVTDMIIEGCEMWVWLISTDSSDVKAEL